MRSLCTAELEERKLQGGVMAGERLDPEVEAEMMGMIEDKSIEELQEL